MPTRITLRGACFVKKISCGVKIDAEIAIAQKIFGAKVRKIRISQKLTQEEMDQGKWAIPVRTLQSIESGRTDIKFSTVYKLSKRLKVPMKKLLDLPENF